MQDFQSLGEKTHSTTQRIHKEVVLLKGDDY